MPALRAVSFLISAAMFVLASGTATAAAPVNVYSLGLQVNGAPGAPGYPAPTGLDVQLDTSEQTGLRPETFFNVSFSLSGTTLRGGQVPACSSIADPYSGPEGCPAGSIVGAVEMVTKTGPPMLPADMSLSCYLSGSLVNVGAEHLLLWLEGSPIASADPAKNCPMTVGQYITAQVAVGSTGSTISWYIPANLMHPAGLDSAFTLIHLQLAKPATNAGYTTTTACPTATGSVTNESNVKTTFDAPAFACQPAAGMCPVGQSGTPPNCTTPTPATCPVGQIGTPPDCTTPAVCPVGQTGTPPNCTTLSPATCPAGQVGTPPNCTEPTDPGTQLEDPSLQKPPAVDPPPLTTVPSPPTPPRASIGVSLKGPKGCVKSSFSVAIAASVANAKFASTVVSLDGKKLKTISTARGTATIPSSALKKAGATHRLTATAKTTAGLTSSTAKTSFSVCKKAKKKH